MELEFERTRFDEAFLFLVNSEAQWSVAGEIFPAEKINQIARLVCNYDIANNAPSLLFKSADEASFLKRFKTQYLQVLAEIKDGEIAFRQAQEDPALRGKKAVTRTRDDVAALIAGISKFFDFLVMNDSPKQQKYLESLRVKCSAPTLNLLDYMQPLHGENLLSFQYSFIGKQWTERSVRKLVPYLEQMHQILRLSTKPGGTRWDVLSPVMANLIWRLAILYQKYSGQPPRRSARGLPKDTKTDVITKFYETGSFKDFCLSSVYLINEQLPETQAWNQMLLTDQALIKTMRTAANELKNMDLTGP